MSQRNRSNSLSNSQSHSLRSEGIREYRHGQVASQFRNIWVEGGKLQVLLIVFSSLLLLQCARSSQEGGKEEGGESIDLSQFDIQGHRGARGLLPENSVPGFVKALELGVSTLELDVVVSKDSQVLLSHEPWMSSHICLDADGNALEENAQEQYNIFQLTYEEIQAFDCGSRGNPNFSQQEKVSVPKPLLSQVFDVVESYLHGAQSTVMYNIETKCSPEGDNLFHPEPAVFVELLFGILQGAQLEDRVVIQSFDPRILREVHKRASELSTALLVEGSMGGKQDSLLQDLGFSPTIYSPNWELVDSDLIASMHSQGIKIIPWTVNQKEEMNMLINLGVDGIITDYPDRLVAVVKNRE
ncbi:MAG: glycerophosphodiester phosphodiesterase family protein [Bacteroidota bacterium]